MNLGDVLIWLIAPVIAMMWVLVVVVAAFAVQYIRGK